MGALRISQASFEECARSIARFQDLDTHELLDLVGALVVGQTQRRIASEKTTPEGKPWQPWSRDYAQTRKAGQSLLVGVGSPGLLTSITHVVDPAGDYVDVGSNLPYAWIQQAGGLPGMAPGPAAIPSREYLGVSDANSGDLRAAAERWLDDQWREAVVH